MVNVHLILSNIGYLPNDLPIVQTHQNLYDRFAKNTGAITNKWIECFPLW